MADIFISYSRGDADKVAVLARMIARERYIYSDRTVVIGIPAGKVPREVTLFRLEKGSS